VSYGNGSEPGLNVVGIYSDPLPIAVNYMSIASYAGLVADWIIPAHLFNTSAGPTMASVLRRSAPVLQIFGCDFRHPEL